jgi:hypothetical protein
MLISLYLQTTLTTINPACLPWETMAKAPSMQDQNIGRRIYEQNHAK